jgi:hypothetical protein
MGPTGLYQRALGSPQKGGSVTNSSVLSEDHPQE